MALVNCDTLGTSLKAWLATASAADKTELRELLGVQEPVTLNDCAGTPLATGDSVATCTELTNAVSEVPVLVDGTYNYNTKMLSLILSDGNMVEVEIQFPVCP